MCDRERLASAWKAIDALPESSSLDALETFQQFWRLQSAEQSTAHAVCRNERRVIAEALWDGEETKRRAYRIRDCSQVPVWGIGEEGEVFIRLGLCRDRLCPLCSARRSGEVAERVLQQVAAYDSCRFVTLTLRHRAESLSSALSRLREGFRRLRQRRSWRSKVRSCVFALEVKWNSKMGTWHPHLHILADGDYWDQRDLSREWLGCTGDSPIVDIRAVPSRGAASSYISKYVCKGEGVDRWPPERIREYAVSMHGKRMIETWGRKNVKTISDRVTDETPHRRRLIASIAGLRQRIQQGTEELMLAATIVCISQPVLRRWIGDLTRHNEPGLIPADEAVAERNLQTALNRLVEEFNPAGARQSRRDVVAVERLKQERLWAEGPPQRHAD